MLASFSYDISYEPAAPVIEIQIGASDGTPARLKLTGLIDTGADATMIPLDMLQAAGARFVQRRGLRGVTGERQTVSLYLVAIHIDEHTVHGIRAVATSSGGEIIIGRDVLNNLIVTLNGLASITEIEK
jgi:predicted aspartyl protease